MKKQSVRHKASVALILVDVINHFEFPDGDLLLKRAMPIAAPLARLKKRARDSKIPVVYVNDNFGQWRSDVTKLLNYCLCPDAPSRAFVEPVAPDEEDYFVLKPMHSAFYQTPLDALLEYFGASSLVLCGLATNSCIVCTAHDARMRNFELTVPADCCAARTQREHLQALEHMKTMAGARILQSSAVRFKTLAR